MASPLTVEVDGVEIDYPVAPLKCRGQIMLPAAPTFERLGATCVYDQATKSLLLEAFSDTRTALGVNVGFGVEGFIFDNISVDLRGRYNVLLGELRPMEAWGIEGQTFPMQFWNVRAGMRFYFKG